MGVTVIPGELEGKYRFRELGGRVAALRVSLEKEASSERAPKIEDVSASETDSEEFRVWKKG